MGTRIASTTMRGLTALTALAVAAVASACTPGAAGAAGGTVTVMAVWEGAERDAFLAMIEPFERRTGITVAFTSTRDLSGRLWKGVATGDLPDLAGMPGPGAMREFARAGALVDLRTAIDVAAYKASTAPAFVQLGTVDDRLVGVFTKTTVKGLMWFNPRMFTLATPTTWDDLTRAAATAARGGTRTWCLGLESADASGWPATDWIEDILLRQSGPVAYDDWVAGRLAWTSTPVRQAFETFGGVVASGAVHGGPEGAIATSFADAGAPLFSDPPGCLFLHQAGFMTSFFRDRSGARDGEYDFFPFPVMDPRYADSLIVAGDLFGMFRDTPQSRALMAYLVSAEAQAIRVGSGDALSPNVDVTAYPNQLSRREADLLKGATTVRFDASDLMGEAMNRAFWLATIDYVRDPSRLDAILTGLDRVRTGATVATTGDAR
jgi:alpha-glucoside transport system substrate-binding protein